MGTWKFILSWAVPGFASMEKTIRGSRRWILSQHERFAALQGRELPVTEYSENEGQELSAYLSGHILFLGEIEEE